MPLLGFLSSPVSGAPEVPKPGQDQVPDPCFAWLSPVHAQCLVLGQLGDWVARGCACHLQGQSQWSVCSRFRMPRQQ